MSLKLTQLCHLELDTLNKFVMKLTSIDNMSIVVIDK